MSPCSSPCSLPGTAAAKRSRSARLALGCGVLLLAWLGNGDAQPPPRFEQPEDAAPAARAPASITGTVWQLRDYETEQGLKMAVAGEGNGYVAFEDGEFRLNAGCDTLRGSFLLDGDTLLFSPHVASTLGDCPPTLRAQEQAVLGLLPDVTRQARQDSQLLLLDGDGRTLLTLTAPNQSPLQRQRWVLLAVRNREGQVVPALPEPEITLRFDDASNLSGVACDEYRAGFARDDHAITIEGSVAGTRFGCPASEAATRQAEDYLRMLAQIDSYRVDATSLLLRDADGRMLARFAAMAPEPESQTDQGPDGRQFYGVPGPGTLPAVPRVATQPQLRRLAPRSGANATPAAPPAPSASLPVPSPPPPRPVREGQR